MKYKPREEGTKIQEKDYSKKVIFSLDDFNTSGHLLQTVTIPPHTKQRLHEHSMQTEVYYILEGEASIIINEHTFAARPGDAFIVEPGDKHFLRNQSDIDFTLITFKINKPGDDQDTNWLEE